MVPPQRIGVSMFPKRKRLLRFIFAKNNSHCKAPSQAQTNVQLGGSDVKEMLLPFVCVATHPDYQA
jgi:hypothetical protein